MRTASSRPRALARARSKVDAVHERDQEECQRRRGERPEPPAHVRVRAELADALQRDAPVRPELSQLPEPRSQRFGALPRGGELHIGAEA
jgi:hypothetical protein